MLVAIIVILIVLWFFGYAPISGISIPDPVLFEINNHPISLWQVLILMVLVWAISILPKTFQAIATILLILWVLSELGILAIAGLSSLILPVIIIGLIISLLV